MEYPDKLLSEGETVERAFRPHWKQLIWPGFVTLVALIGLVVLATRVRGTWLWAGLAAVGVIWAILFFPSFIKWMYTHYVVTNERVITRRGMIARQSKEIPLEVINDVAFSQTVWERLLHSGDLRIESAGEMGQSRFFDIPDPDEIQALIYRLREARTLALQGPAQSASPVEQLEALARLHRDGVLTDEEFAEKKAKLLGQM